MFEKLFQFDFRVKFPKIVFFITSLNLVGFCVWRLALHKFSNIEKLPTDTIDGLERNAKKKNQVRQKFAIPPSVHNEYSINKNNYFAYGSNRDYYH